MREKKSATPRTTTAGGDERILVVDDDARVLDLLRITLTGRGFDVTIAKDGADALRRAQSTQPDLVVMNTRLPGRDGLKVLEEIRATSSMEALPVILISSDASSGAKLQGFRRGADDYVSKPFSPRELILRIRKILDRVGKSRNLEQRIRELEAALSRGEKALDETRAELRGRLFRVGGVVGELQTMGHTTGTDDLLRRFAKVAISHLNLDVAALFLMDDAGEEYVCRIIRGWEHESTDALTVAGDGPLAAEVGDATRLLSLQSVGSIPEMSAEAARLMGAGLRYAYPVRVQGEPEGMICIGTIEGTGELDPIDVDLLKALADAVGDAVASQRSQSHLHHSFLNTAGLLIQSLEKCYTGFEGHSQRVAGYAVSIAEAIGIPAQEVEAVRLGAELHDLGLVEIYDRLGEQTYPLPQEDRIRLVEAPLKAAEAISGAGLLDAVAEIVRHHHESWDGSGYPEGLGAESIPIGARIVAIANSFDALTHDRPHRDAHSVDDAVATLVGEAGRSFDPDLVDTFVGILAKQESPAA